jgi:transposase
MPRKTHIELHLSLEELKQKIRRCRETVARQQLRVIYWIMQGYTQKSVAEKTGYSAAWVHAIVQRFNAGGVGALRDHRKENPGRPYRLSHEVREEMRVLVSKPPQLGGMWTGPKLVAWVRERTNDQNIDNKRGWEWLKQMNCKNRLKRRRKRTTMVNKRSA